MNSVDKQYFDLIRHIKEFGVEKLDRTGTGTKSIFSYDMRFNMQEGFPLMTSKKMAWKAMVVELLWFLKGDTNIKYLVDNGCYIWVGDAYKNYLKYPLPDITNKYTNILWKNITKGWCVRIGLGIVEPDPTRHLTREEFIEKIKTDNDFANEFGELGPVYGKQWRNWTYFTRDKKENIEGIDEAICGVDIWDGYGYLRSLDQIQKLISDLKLNPDSRRLIVNAWNVGEIDSMVLPPCHYGFQCYTRKMSTDERNKWFHKHRNGLNPNMKYDWKDYELDQQNIPDRALSLKFNMRSIDVPLGLPFNIASYGLLLHLLAKEVNMVPDELILSGGDCHIYLNQMEGVEKQLKQKTYPLPKLVIANKSIYDITYEDIKLVGYQSAEKIDIPLSN
jgi:thymidylate synthase